jgi:hypothetical protein
MTATALQLDLDVDDDNRELDALTTRAIRLALWPHRSVDDVAADLVVAAHNDVHLLDAAIARIDRALAVEWSRTGTTALVELETARELALAGAER